MKVFIVLISAFAIAVGLIKIFTGKYNLLMAAGIGMSIVLLFTSLGHFMYTKGMSMMIPNLVPFKEEFVYFTGILEIAAAIGLQIKKLRKLTAWLLIGFFVLILPANIFACIHHVDMYQANYRGEGIHYLLFRIPLQLFLVGWTYLFLIKLPERHDDSERARIKGNYAG